MPAIAPTYRAQIAIASAIVVSSTIAAMANEQDGIVRVKSAHAMKETISLVKTDIADKGIRFFSEIDHSMLAADAGVKLRPDARL